MPPSTSHRSGIDIGFNELVLYTSRDHELAVFDQVTAQLDSYR